MHFKFQFYPTYSTKEKWEIKISSNAGFFFVVISIDYGIDR